MATKKKMKLKKISSKKDNEPAVKVDEKTFSIKYEWIIIAVLTLLFLTSLGYIIMTKLIPVMKPNETVTTDQVRTKVKEYIDNNLLGGTVTSEITGVSENEEYDFYEVTVKVQNQEYTFYVSTDGKFLYLQRYDMNEQPEETTTTTTVPITYTKTEKPKVLLFTMSYCPYGNVAEDMIKPVIDLMKDKITVEPHYIINKTDTGYTSLHGDQELHENVRELCINKYQPDKYWDFVMAVNSGCTSANVDSCWESIASANGIDTAKIKTCQTNEATALIESEIELSTQYNASASPTTFINETKYSGARTPEAFKTTLCTAFIDTPSECSETLSGSSTTASGSCD